MDNEAFKDLVRSKVRTTKEIAREAVEEAFLRKKKKRKRKGRGGGGDDDLSSSSESESESRKNNKRENLSSLQPSIVRKKWGNNEKKEDAEEKAPKYRDRAKERREDKNEDYKDTEQIMESVAAANTSMNPAEFAQYLGGDEQHTYLVKGLDVALARSIKNQQKQKSTGTSDQDSEEEERPGEFKPLQTSDEAWNYIVQADNGSVRSILGRSMLQYLKGRRSLDYDNISTTAAGASIQRSQTTFSTNGNHPLNLATCWEIPTETSHAASTTQSTSLSKASPLDLQLIYKIQQIKKTSSGKSAVDDASQQSSDAAPVKYKNDSAASNMGEADDSDDDIFQNLCD